MTSNLRWSWWTPLISNKSDGQFHKTLKIPGLREHCLPKCDAIAHKSEMWIKRNTNPSPNFIVIQFDLAVENQWKIHGEKSENQSEQIQTSVSPNFIVTATPPLTLRPFLDTLWWTLVNKRCSTSIWLYVGGLINRFPPVWCTFHWSEAGWKICIAVGGVAAAVSVFVKLNQYMQILRRQCCLIHWRRTSWYPFQIAGHTI